MEQEDFVLGNAKKIVLGYTTEDFMRQQKYRIIGDRLPIVSETFTSLQALSGNVDEKKRETK